MGIFDRRLIVYIPVKNKTNKPKKKLINKIKGMK